MINFKTILILIIAGCLQYNNGIGQTVFSLLKRKQKQADQKFEEELYLQAIRSENPSGTYIQGAAEKTPGMNRIVLKLATATSVSK